MVVVVAVERLEEPGRNRRRAAVALGLVSGLAAKGWRVVGASVAGTSHASTRAACQDYHAARIVEKGGAAFVLLGLADGAGSASASLYGAKTAVDAALNGLASEVRRAGSAAVIPETLREALRDARACVFEAADEFGHIPGEYASTLLLVVAAPDRTLCAHVGDGAVVVEDDALAVLSFPEQGEYVNATRFLVDDDALSTARLVEYGPVQRVALLSDGLQGLALDYRSRSAYAPFFMPIFAHIEAAEAPIDSLAAQLETWLESPAVSRRTGDDKSLLVAARTP